MHAGELEREHIAACYGQVGWLVYNPPGEVNLLLDSGRMNRVDAFGKGGFGLWTSSNMHSNRAPRQHGGSNARPLSPAEALRVARDVDRWLSLEASHGGRQDEANPATCVAWVRAILADLPGLLEKVHSLAQRRADELRNQRDALQLVAAMQEPDKTEVEEDVPF